MGGKRKLTSHTASKVGVGVARNKAGVGVARKKVGVGLARIVKE